MLIQIPRASSGFTHPFSSEITSREAYLKRRDTLRLLAGGAAGTLLSSFAVREALAATAAPGKLKALASMPSKVAGATTVEKITDYKDASTYNNYYEFGLSLIHI
jgi:sulfoxide reductase catalytic subunit YedY